MTATRRIIPVATSPQSTVTEDQKLPTAQLNTDSPAPTTTVSLTTFQDQEDVKLSGEPTPPGVCHIPPVYPDICTDNTIDKLYIIGRFSWEATDTIGTVLQTFNLPNDLLTVQSLYEKLCRFNYMTTDLELEIRINATPFHSGQLLLYWMPDCSPTELALYNTSGAPIWTMSMANPTVILANTVTPVRLEIPYQHQFQYLRLPNCVNMPGALCSMAFAVLAPLVTSSSETTTSIDVTVWARFKNPAVIGNMTKPWAVIPPSPGTPSGPKFKKLIAKDNKQKLLQRKAVRPESEAQSKSTQNVVHNGKDRTSAFKSTISSIPVIGGLISAATDAASLFGLDKPASLKAVDFNYPDTTRGDFQGQGLDKAEPLSISNRPFVSDARDAFGCSDPACDSFKALSQKPSLQAITSVPNTALAGTVIAQFPVAPYYLRINTMVVPTWASTAASYYRYWRGGMKYSFIFSTSSFSTVRVRIMWTPEQDTGITETTGGDCVNQIVDVKGDTMVNITIPYLKESLFLSTPHSVELSGHQNGWITLALVNDPVSLNQTDGLNFLFFSTWVAMAEDVQFSRPNMPTRFAPPSLSESPSPEGDMGAIFGKTFPPIIKATSTKVEHFVTSEEIYSTRTFSHRYQYNSIWNIDSSFAPPSPYPVGIINTAGPIPFPVFCLYRFFRGSMRAKFYKVPPSTVQPTYQPNTTFQARVVSTVDDVLDPDSETPYNWRTSYIPDGGFAYIELPYNSTANYWKFPDNSSRGVVKDTWQVQIQGGNLWTYVAGGDDISFGCPCPQFPLPITV